jgi:hypothetical protein
MNDLTYPYKPNLWVLILAALSFAAVTCLLAEEAMSNERGLVLNEMIHFSQTGATIIYWCIVAMAAMFVILAVPLLLAGLRNRHHVTLTATEISAPMHACSRSIIAVPLTDITGLEVQALQYQRSLVIYHANGELSISQHLLPNASAFEELCSAIAERAPRLSRG